MLNLALRFSIAAVLSVLIYQIYDYFAPAPIYTEAKQGSNKSQTDTLQYLNSIRSALNLSEFKLNLNLEQAADAHAKYLAKNHVLSHDQMPGNDGFSGKTPADRALNSSYFSKYVVENISQNSPDQISSIDQLLSAIYHRFGFLNFDFDEIGFASKGDKNDVFYAYEMGNSRLNSLCQMSQGDEFNGDIYVLNLCARDVAIQKSSFERALRVSSADFIAFPSANLGVGVFSDEKPNPLPECKITANPVSIEFNPKFKNIKMLDFELFENGKKIENTIILTKSSDINHKFKDNQFAVFSKKIFEFDKDYRAKFSYLQDGKNGLIEWNFNVKKPEFDYFVVSDGDKISLQPGKTYNIFFRPTDCDDKFDAYSYVGADARISQDGANMLRLSLEGKKGDFVRIKTSTNSTIEAYLSADSPSGVRERLYIFILTIFILLTLIFNYKARKQNG